MKVKRKLKLELPVFSTPSAPACNPMMVESSAISSSRYVLYGCLRVPMHAYACQCMSRQAWSCTHVYVRACAGYSKCVEQLQTWRRCVLVCSFVCVCVYYTVPNTTFPAYPYLLFLTLCNPYLPFLTLSYPHLPFLHGYYTGPTGQGHHYLRYW